MMENQHEETPQAEQQKPYEVIVHADGSKEIHYDLLEGVKKPTLAEILKAAEDIFPNISSDRIEISPWNEDALVVNVKES